MFTMDSHAGVGGSNPLPPTNSFKKLGHGAMWSLLFLQAVVTALSTHDLPHIFR